MSKIIGNATIFKAQEYQRKDGTLGCRCQGFTDEGDIVVFYRPAEEKPNKDTVYNMITDVDSKFNAVIRYQLKK